MHFSSLVPVLLVLAPAAVSAVGQLGFALGTKNPDGSCKYTADYEADFDTLKSQSTVVRGYAADDCNFAQQILPAAKNKGFQVLLGIWADTDIGFNAGKAAVLQYAAQYPQQVYGVTVGSESLYRGNFTGEELADKIVEVKRDVERVVPNIKVGTADSWNKYADGTADAVVRVSNLILCNAFAYWQGESIDDARETFVDDIYQALAHIEDVLGTTAGIDFWVGETGWPSDGGIYGRAVPTTANAQRYWKESICFIRSWNVKVFAFEAFDEPWKPTSVGENGQAMPETHWGVFTANRSPKYDLSC